MLNREPMGMKLIKFATGLAPNGSFSAQPRADGDEASAHAPGVLAVSGVSVLNREPMGMKHDRRDDPRASIRVSVLNREPMGMKQS